MKAYIEQNRQRFLDELFALLRLPSVSADPKYAGHVTQTAEVVAEHLRNAGATTVEIVETPGYPVVYAEKMMDPALPTVCVYGTTMCNLRIRWSSGTATPSNPKSAKPTSTPRAPFLRAVHATTKGSSSCT